MDFTREPIIETVVTPKEGCKLVIRSSKSIGQEEYFVDAVQVVSFGNSIFFRSLERPKAFLLPASDYEVLEVREARIVLKNVPTERSIKIGGGRDANMRSGKDSAEEKEELKVPESLPSSTEGEQVQPKGDSRADKRRDRRRQYRRKRGREENSSFTEEVPTLERVEGGEIKIDLIPPEPIQEGSEQEKIQTETMSRVILSELLTPPPSLISETIARYKDNASFKEIFITAKDVEKDPIVEEVQQIPSIPIEQPALGSFEMDEEDEEEIYRQRKRRFGFEEEVVREHKGREDHPPLPEEEPPYSPEGL